MKNLIFGLLFILSLSLNAQWKGTTSNDDQRTMMVQRHMDLYPKNDQSQLKNLLTSDATININGVDVPGGVDGLAEGERMHHKIFKTSSLKLVQILLQNMKMVKHGHTYGLGGLERGKKQKIHLLSQFILHLNGTG